MFRGNAHEGRAIYGVRSGGEYGDSFVRTTHGKDEFRSGAFPYPVSLHGEDSFGPPGHTVRVVEELI